MVLAHDGPNLGSGRPKKLTAAEQKHRSRSAGGLCCGACSGDDSTPLYVSCDCSGQPRSCVALSRQFYSHPLAFLSAAFRRVRI
jgi:hypothetical protein